MIIKTQCLLKKFNYQHEQKQSGDAVFEIVERSCPQQFFGDFRFSRRVQPVDEKLIQTERENYQNRRDEKAVERFDNERNRLSAEQDGSIKINNQNFGNLENTDQLSNKLSEVFREREKMNVLDEYTNKVVKGVIVRGSRSEKYKDVVEVIHGVKISGADPMILQIDDLPE